MNFQDRYDTALHLLLTTHPTKIQKEISKELSNNGVECSDSALSRGKSAGIDNSTYRKRAGNLPPKRLQEIALGMEELLSTRKTNAYVFEGDHYRNIDTDEIQNSIFTDSPIIPTSNENLGIVHSYAQFPNGYVKAQFSNATAIRIIQTYFTDTESFYHCFEMALEAGASIKILILDKQSEAVRLRTKALKVKKANVRDKIEDNLNEFEELSIKYPKNFEIRKYNELPSVNLLAFETKEHKRLVCGWYWFNEYAINGTYLELEDDNRFHLSKNINDHWNALWSSTAPAKDSKDEVRYRCFYYREQKKEEFSILLDRSSGDVLLFETPSGDKYKGLLLNLRGYASIRVETVDEAKLKIGRRVASFIINIGNRRRFGSQEVAIAVYSNISPRGRAYGNIMVLAKYNKESNDLSLENERVIWEYLRDSELRIQDSNVYNFKDLGSIIEKRNPDVRWKHNFLDIIKGEYHGYVFSGQNDLSLKMSRIQIKINEGGAVEFKSRVTVSGKVEILNVQNILMTKITTRGSSSYFYILKPVDKELSALKGAAVGLSIETNSPKQVCIYLVKSKSAFSKPRRDDAPFGQAKFEELKHSLGENFVSFFNEYLAMFNLIK